MSARMLAEADALVGLWSCKTALGGGATFDAALDLQMTTLDAIVNITIGSSPQCLTAAYASPLAIVSHPTSSPGVVCFVESNITTLHSIMQTIMRGIENVSSAAFPGLSARLFLWTSPTWRGAYKTFTQFFIDEIVRARVREHGKAASSRGNRLATDADCVLDMLLQREAREDEEPLSQRELLDELLSYVFAGQDTTASALCWLVKFLALDPKVQYQLHEEVCTIFGQNTGQEAELDYDILDSAERAPILEAVVTETLRCASIVSLTGRERKLSSIYLLRITYTQATEVLGDEVVLGRRVPKGTQIMFPIGYMGAMESEWGSDAKLWRPSRWLRSDGSFNRKAGSSVVFGLGQRSCFGERLAIVQIKVFAATLSRAFFFKPVPPEISNFDAVQVVTRQPKHCYVRLEEWPSSSFDQRSK
ncbi:cytochrome P450 family protein [Ceratobasidium sp. AG-Ba]|nr:cytochrome P450 family protein [Ceratobasidium sp. AG-Ba]